MSTGDQECEFCKFWLFRVLGNQGDGQCRRRAPVALPFFVEDYLSYIATDDEPQGFAKFTSWPRTSGDDWCGDFQAREAKGMSRPVKIKPSDLKDGKVVIAPRAPRSVSEAVRQKKSKRTRVAKPGPRIRS